MNIRKKSIKPLFEAPLDLEEQLMLAKDRRLAHQAELISMVESAQPEQRTSGLYDFLHRFSREDLSRLYHKADNLPGESIQKAKRAIEDRLGLKPVKKEYGFVSNRNDE